MASNGAGKNDNLRMYPHRSTGPRIPEEFGSFLDPGKVDAEGLHLMEQVSDVDDAVANERMQEDAHQAHQPILNILVLLQG
eukprot:1160209-Pelagomonas_calceolata.AAC.1